MYWLFNSPYIVLHASFILTHLDIGQPFRATYPYTVGHRLGKNKVTVLVPDRGSEPAWAQWKLEREVVEVVQQARAELHDGDRVSQQRINCRRRRQARCRQFRQRQIETQAKHRFKRFENAALSNAVGCDNYTSNIGEATGNHGTGKSVISRPFWSLRSI